MQAKGLASARRATSSCECVQLCLLYGEGISSSGIFWVGEISEDKSEAAWHIELRTLGRGD